MCIVYDHSSPGIENQGRCWLELGLAQSIYPRLRAVFVVNSEAATLNIRVSLLQLVKFLRTWLQTVLSKLSVPFVKQCILFSVPLSIPWQKIHVSGDLGSQAPRTEGPLLTECRLMLRHADLYKQPSTGGITFSVTKTRQSQTADFAPGLQ